MKKKGNPSRKKSTVLLIVLSVLIAVWSVLTFVPFEYGVKDYISVAGGIVTGKDLGDGVFAEAEIKRPQNDDGVDISDKDFDDLIQKSLRTMQKRLDTMSYTDASVKVQQRLDGEVTKYFMRAELPTSTNAEQVLKILLNNGKIEFKFAEDYKDETIIDNSGLNAKDTVALYNSADQSNYIIFILNDSGKDKVTAATTEIVGLEDTNLKTMPIVIGGEVFYSPSLGTSALTSYDVSMPVGSLDEAKGIEALVKHGALEISFEEYTVKASDAGFGYNAMINLAIAAAAAFVVFVILMIIFYKGLGVVSAISALVFILIYVLALTFVPGVQFGIFSVAAIVASLAMFIATTMGINERISEEYKIGKTTKLAIAEGHKRSFFAILDIHLLIFVASILLLVLSNSKVSAFGLALAIGAFASAFVAYIVNRMFLRIFAAITNKSSFFGLKKVEEEKPCKLVNRDYKLPKIKKTLYVVSSAVITAGIVLNLIFGFNASFDLSKNYESVTVVVGHEESINPETNGTNFAKINAKIKDIISDYATSKNLNVTFGDVRFTGMDSSSALYLEYSLGNVAKEQSLSYNAEIEKALSDSLKPFLNEIEIEDAKLNNFNVTAMHSSSYSKIALPAFFAVLILAAVMFIYMAIRFKVAIAAAGVITVIHNVLAVLALITIVRLPLSLTMVAGLFASAIITYIGMFIVAEKSRENFTRLSLKDEHYSIIIKKSIKESIRPLVKFAAIIFAISICFILVGAIAGFTSYTLFALPLLLISLLVVYSSIFIFNELIADFKEVGLKNLKNRKVIADKKEQAKIADKSKK